MENELDDLRKLAIRLSLKLVKAEEEIEIVLRDKELFRKWYYEERTRATDLNAEAIELKDKLKRVMEIPEFNKEIPGAIA